MGRGGGRGGRRNRRTRHQLLIESVKASNVDPDPGHSPVQNDPAGGSSVAECDNNSELKKKQSLRLLFQHAKTRTSDGSSRKKKVMSYNWPRTVEAAVGPEKDPRGKNKWFFAIAIDLHPSKKYIIQPSDSESDEEEEEEDEHLEEEGEEVILVPDEEPISAAAKEASLSIKNIKLAYTSQEEDPPSPESPKIRRGRRPAKARRTRAPARDHSWRAGGPPAKRGKKKPRKRVDNSELIQEVLDTVIQRKREEYEARQRQRQGAGSNISYPSGIRAHMSSSETSSVVELPKPLDPVNPHAELADLLDVGVAKVKEEVATEELSSSEGGEVDVEDDEDDVAFKIWNGVRASEDGQDLKDQETNDDEDYENEDPGMDW